MNEKLEEIKLLVKNDRRIWAIGGFILLAVGFMVIVSDPDRPRREVQLSQGGEASETTLGPNEGYRDLAVALKNDVEKLTKFTMENQEVMARLKEESKRDQQRTSGIFDSIIDKIEALAREVERVSEESRARAAASSADLTLSQGTLGDGTGEDSLEGFGFDQATVPPPPAPPAPTRVSFISPGDSVKASLLTGVNAPVDGTPYPVMFRIEGPVTGPDGSELEIGEARLIAAAHGSETDERVLYRLTELSIRHKDGRRSTVKVDGWIVGEDGIRGMKGKVIDNLGAVIAATALVSGVAAIGERLDEQSANIDVENSDNITVNSDDLQVGAASALTDASIRLTSIILDRYEKQIPVVEVLSGREVVAVFASGSEVEILEEDFDGEGIYSASLMD